MKHVLITGVSTGIGYSCTKSFLANGYKVLGTVRKKEDADRLQNEFGTDFYPIIYDVTDYDSIDAIKQEVKDQLAGASLAGLINNAGISVNGPVSHVSIENFKKQFEVNFFAQISITQTFLPLMGLSENFEGEPEKIMMISSISGKMVFPFTGPYSSSKFALEAYSDALRRELMAYGIKVIIIEPGPVKSAIWGKFDESEIEKFKDTRFYNSINKFKNYMMSEGENGIDTDKFGNKIVGIFESRNPKTRYVIIKNKLKNFTIPSLLSDKTLDNFMAKMIGLIKK